MCICIYLFFSLTICNFYHTYSLHVLLIYIFFHFFGNNSNGYCVLILVSSCSFSAYENAINFCVGILIKLTIISRIYFIDSLGIFIYVIISTANKDSFIFFQMVCIVCFCLLPMSSIYSTTLNNVDW